MIRTVIFTTFLLALAGTASAADVVKVSVSGKTEVVIKSELAAAAKSVCGNPSPLDADTCVEATYNKALQQWEKLKASKMAAFVF